jgi:DNA-binding CsgD family transcriptional regulator
VTDRASQRLVLEQAVETVSGQDLATSLESVVAPLPLAVSVEAATIRVRAAESDQLYLLAAEGIPFRDVRRLGLEQLTIPQARTLVAMGASHRKAIALGLVWLHGQWLTLDEEPLGLVFVGCRTARRPSAEELSYLAQTGARLTERLRGLDRSASVLRPASLALVRRLVLESPVGQDGPLRDLRPRERAILELYADDLSAAEIAELLVISPHTVRTHLKLAFRRLGVHSREEATRLVRRDQLATLL